MARVCQLTGKKALRARRVSHSNVKTLVHLKPNLQRKTFYIPELKRSIRLRVSARAIKTINKKGIYTYLKQLEKIGIKVV